MAINYLAKNKTEITEELRDCSLDIVYFAEKYFSIINFKSGKQIIKLPQFQKNLLYNFVDNKNTIVLAPRQSFKTTTSLIYALWYAMFNSDKTVALLYHNKNMSKIALLELKTAYEDLPDFMKPGVNKYNSNCIEFDNGSQIISCGVTEDALRGQGISVIILDEFAYVNNKNAEKFFNSHFPIIQYSGKCIISSTPSNTKHLFKTLWKQALEGCGDFTPVRVYWWEMEGRDEKWRDEMINFMGKVKFNVEYDCKFEDEN